MAQQGRIPPNSYKAFPLLDVQHKQMHGLEILYYHNVRDALLLRQANSAARQSPS